MTTEQTQTKGRVNYALKIVGNLMHDNKLFNRTCPQCRGMYSSFEKTHCPKCNSLLTFITTNDGQNKPMSISEGTVALCFGPKQEEKDRKAIANRKNGLTPLYRFKRFSFADDNGVLAMPKDHHRMKSGAQVEITIINHQAIPSGPFQTKKHGATVEQMLLIFDDQGYGDTVKVLRDSQAIANNIPVQVDGNGQPVPVDVSQMAAQIAAMESQIAAMKAAVGAVPPTQVPAQSEVAAVAEMEEPPFEDTVTTDSDADPFDGAL